MKNFDKDLYHIYENGGMKENRDKRDYTLLPWKTINEVVDIMQYGAKKYSRDNWKKVPSEEYIKASFRHIISHLMEEDYDKESSFSHLSHAICDLIYACENHFPNSNKDHDTTKQMEFDFETPETSQAKEVVAALKHISTLDRQMDTLNNIFNTLDMHELIKDDMYAGW